MSKPSIGYDESSKAVMASGPRFSADTRELVGRYNGLVDAITLLQNPDAIHGLPNDITHLPEPVQKVVASIRCLLSTHTEQVKASTEQDRETALNELRAQLETEAQQALTDLGTKHGGDLTQLREDHAQQMQALTQQTGAALDAQQKLVTISQNTSGLYHRMDTYTTDAYTTAANLGETSGLHPVVAAVLSSNGLYKELRLGPVNLGMVLSGPDRNGQMHDLIVVTTSKDTPGPELRSIVLEVRKDPDHPGLTPKGRQQLADALLAFKPAQYAFMAKHYTPEELAAVYQDPSAAAEHFDALASRRALSVAFARFGGGNTGFITLEDFLSSDEPSKTDNKTSAKAAAPADKPTGDFTVDPRYTRRTRERDYSYLVEEGTTTHTSGGSVDAPVAGFGTTPHHGTARFSDASDESLQDTPGGDALTTHKE